VTEETTTYTRSTTKPDPDQIIAICRDCGASYNRAQLAILDCCTVCGVRFVDPEDDNSPPPLDVLALQGRWQQVAEAQDELAALAAVTDDAPALFALLAEYQRALIALCGSCSCRTARIEGRKPGKNEACPHRRAQRALARAGFRREQFELVRRSLGLVIP
jgi:predicted  nucleic acid-binding Zn-ribbon protein